MSVFATSKTTALTLKGVKMNKDNEKFDRAVLITQVDNEDGMEISVKSTADSSDIRLLLILALARAYDVPQERVLEFMEEVIKISVEFLMKGILDETGKAN